MGNDPSKIDLSREDGGYKTAQYAEVTVKSGDYESYYKKYIYSLKYYKSSYSWINRKYFYLSFSKREYTREVFYYYANTDRNIIDEIEVYFSKIHTDIPLILGFRTRANGDFKYYKYVELRDKVKSSTGLPKVEHQVKNLKTELGEENNKRNKLRFKIGATSENYLEKIDDGNFGDFIQYRYYVDEQKTYSNYVFSTDRLLQYETGKNRIDYSFLYPVDDRLYDYVYVYYTKPKHNQTAVLIEFIDDSGKTHFQKKDVDGHYWVNENINYYNEENLKAKFPEIKTEYEKTTSFLLDRTESYGNSVKLTVDSITVYNSRYNYTIYKHVPKTDYANENHRIVYKNELFKVIGIEDRSIQEKPYKEIDTYSFDKSRQVHLLVKFCYSNEISYFKRVDKIGNTWQKLTEQEKSALDRDTSANLAKINYEINQSIKIQLEKNLYEEYPIKLVSNFPPGTSVSGIGGNFSIIVTKNRECVPDSTYECHKHSIPELKEYNKHEDIVGLRLYVRDKEIEMYKNTDTNQENREYLNFKSNGIIYVHFFTIKNTRLLVCYNGISYRPEGKDSNKWVKVPEIGGCSKSDQSVLKGKLEEIKKELYPEQTRTHTSTRGDVPTELGQPQSSDTLGAQSLGGAGNYINTDNQSTEKGSSGSTLNTPIGENKFGKTIETNHQAPGPSSRDSSDTQIPRRDPTSTPDSSVKSSPQEEKGTQVTFGSHDDRSHQSTDKNLQKLDENQGIPLEKLNVEESDRSLFDNSLGHNTVPTSESPGTGYSDSSDDESFWDKFKNFFIQKWDVFSIGSGVSLVGTCACGYGLYLLLR